jgi:hypothetical protein
MQRKPPVYNGGIHRILFKVNTFLQVKLAVRLSHREGDE